PCEAFGTSEGAACDGREIRSRPAAPGSDAARGESRHSRGARPADDPCGGRAQAFEGRWAGRPQARFSRAGTEPRIEYAMRQGERRFAYRHGARSEGGGGSVPRAGAEPRMKKAKK